MNREFQFHRFIELSVEFDVADFAVRRAGKIADPKWLVTYQDRQTESKEPTFEVRRKVQATVEKVISINSAKTPRAKRRSSQSADGRKAVSRK